MAEAAANPGRRRAYWLSLLALAVALPAAAIVHTEGGVIDLVRQSMREPTEVARGTAQEYGGGTWKMTDLTRLPGDLPGTAAILVRFEVTVNDAGQMADSLCEAVLTDEAGRNWKPVFQLPRAVREARSKMPETSRCGSFAEAKQGATLALAESFVVPSDAQDLSLLVSLNNALPDSLRLR